MATVKGKASTVKKKSASAVKQVSKPVTLEPGVFKDAQWVVRYGKLQPPPRKPGRPPQQTEHLFRVIGEKLPFEALSSVQKHLAKELEAEGKTIQGVYVAHDSMGCPRYIGRGAIFNRLAARKKAQQLELEYFSFYVVADKKHEREIETLLIRTAGFLLEFNERKKRVGILPGRVSDYEAGTYYYHRAYTR